MAIYVHKKDLPAEVKFQGKSLAIDTETRGLILPRDRLCVVQLSDGCGDAHLVQIEEYEDAVNLKKLLSNKNIQKIFHYARFDVAVFAWYFKITLENVYCTKIASKIARTYSSHHSLKTVCKELAGIELSKQQQCSDWSVKELSAEQIKYAANDVLYLHKVQEKLDQMLISNNLQDIAKSSFDFIATRVKLDMLGYDNMDIFSHAS